MTKKQKRDILDDLLGGGRHEPVPNIEALDKIIRQEQKPPAAKGKAKGKSAGPAVPKPAKKKSTHYISEEIFERLDETKGKINNWVPDELKHRVSKSQIVDQALKMILKEFEKKGKQSLIMRQLLKEAKEDSKK